MRELTLNGAQEHAAASGLADVRMVRSQAPERIVVDEDALTGTRLKYFSASPDVDYWTRRWAHAGEVSYAREMRGHLPHQLRDTFRRWVSPGARTLEAGCGLGHFTVATHVLGYRAEGVDWSGEIIGRLRQRFAGIPWHVGDVRRLEFPDQTFDAVYSPGVCEHFEEGPSAILSETRRILRPGGVAIISTPCFNAWLQRRIVEHTSAAEPDAPFFQYAFTPEGLGRLVATLGFDVLQVRPYATLDSFMRYGGWRVPVALQKPAAVALDYLPVLRQWGSTCIWVARKV